MVNIPKQKRVTCYLGIDRLWSVTIDDAPLTDSGDINWGEVERIVIEDAVAGIQKEITTMSKSDLREILRIRDVNKLRY